jgi:hypothetical protein
MNPRSPAPTGVLVKIRLSTWLPHDVDIRRELSLPLGVV